MITGTSPDDRPPPRCGHCGADSMCCEVKAGLSGRRCCDACSHVDVGTKREPKS